MSLKIMIRSVILYPSGPDVFVVVMTLGYRSDLEALLQLAQKSFAYLGLMGSEAKVTALKEELMKNGFPQILIQTMHAPIGLKINSHTPEEIAVSIGAELISVKNTLIVSHKFNALSAEQWIGLIGFIYFCRMAQTIEIKRQLHTPFLLRLVIFWMILFALFRFVFLAFHINIITHAGLFPAAQRYDAGFRLDLSTISFLIFPSFLFLDT
ncbi:MAG: XdhC family protein [Saprospiraceae bacterium]|uniref:XdhC family protein n=1 Tax=Candidatus Opimibacter skivensis TaxID=2982028 RepID=A0A9D7SX75_9BACT|nr:XdhC family protein [Candidatus Opimibacter skivensis]